MSAEQAPRLSLGRRIAMGGGFLFLAAAGLTDTGLAIGESLHNTGVAASAEFKGNEHTAKATYHERTLDNYGALGGLVVAAGSTAAAAVSMIGRMRCSVASTTASQTGRPSSFSCSIFTIKITELRIKMPIKASTPRIATKPRGAPLGSRAMTTPIKASGATANTRNNR